MRIWRVRPKGSGEQWLVISPDSHITVFFKGDLAIEFSRQRAMEAHEMLIVYSGDERVLTTEDYRAH